MIDERLGHRSVLSLSRLGHVIAAWWKVSSSSMHSRQVRSWSKSYGFGCAARTGGLREVSGGGRGFARVEGGFGRVGGGFGRVGAFPPLDARAWAEGGRETGKYGRFLSHPHRRKAPIGAQRG